MVFWIISRMKAKKEHVDKELRVIKLFANNYARDLIYFANCVVLYFLNFQSSHTNNALLSLPSNTFMMFVAANSDIFLLVS